MSAPPSPTIKLEIASRLDLLETVHTLLAQLSSQAGFDENDTHYMSVAVREAVVNAIKHAHRMDASKTVSITFALQRDALEIRVRDHGAGFDPVAVPDPLAEENLLKGDGRGIYFMRSFMDEVSYAFPARGGTIVTMVKHRQAMVAIGDGERP
jgi:serine/threonine-protein kinase RsbW